VDGRGFRPGDDGLEAVRRRGGEAAGGRATRRYFGRENMDAVNAIDSSVVPALSEDDAEV
jgi:hypothetical protein